MHDVFFKRIVDSTLCVLNIYFVFIVCIFFCEEFVENGCGELKFDYDEVLYDCDSDIKNVKKDNTVSELDKIFIKWLENFNKGKHDKVPVVLKNREGTCALNSFLYVLDALDLYEPMKESLKDLKPDEYPMTRALTSILHKMQFSRYELESLRNAARDKYNERTREYNEIITYATQEIKRCEKPVDVFYCGDDVQNGEFYIVIDPGLIKEGGLFSEFYKACRSTPGNHDFLEDICLKERQSIIPSMIAFNGIFNVCWRLKFSGMLFHPVYDTYYTFIKKYNIYSARALCEQLSEVFSANAQETRYPKILVGEEFKYSDLNLYDTLFIKTKGENLRYKKYAVDIYKRDKDYSGHAYSCRFINDKCLFLNNSSVSPFDFDHNTDFNYSLTFYYVLQDG